MERGQKNLVFKEGELPQPILISPEDSSENLNPNVNLSWTVMLLH
jgi:hypothetical protein